MVEFDEDDPDVEPHPMMIHIRRGVHKATITGFGEITRSKSQPFMLILPIELKIKGLTHYAYIYSTYDAICWIWSIKESFVGAVVDVKVDYVAHPTAEHRKYQILQNVRILWSVRPKVPPFTNNPWTKKGDNHGGVSDADVGGMGCSVPDSSAHLRSGVFDRILHWLRERL